MIFLSTYQSSPALPFSCEYETAGTATIFNQSCVYFFFHFSVIWSVNKHLLYSKHSLALCGHKDLVDCFLLSVTMNPFIVKMSNSNKFSLMDPRWRILCQILRVSRQHIKGLS